MAAAASTTDSAAAATASTAAAVTTTSTAKTMKQLMDEIDQAKTEIDTAVKPLEKLDLGRKKLATNRDEAIKGRTTIRNLAERVVTLRQQMDAMTKDKVPTDDKKSFDKNKKNSLKKITELSKHLDQVDKRLEKATGTMPVTTTATATPTATTESENPKGVRALLGRFGSKKKTESKESLAATTTSAKPLDGTGDTTQKTTKDEVTDDDEEDEESDEEEDDDDVISDKKREPAKSPRSPKRPTPTVIDRKKTEVTNVETDDDEEEEDDDDEDDDDDGVNDTRQLADALQSRISTDDLHKTPTTDDRRARTPTTPRSSIKKVPSIKTDAILPSPKPKKTPTITQPPSPSPPVRKEKPRPEVPVRKRRDEEDEDEDEEEDSYFEEEEEDEDEEAPLRRSRDTGDRDEVDSEHDYAEAEDEMEGPTVVNAQVQQLRTNKYSPGTQFLVTHDLKAVQTGDLTIHKGDVVTLVEQRADDWWLFKNLTTQQEGVTPINHIQPYVDQRARRRIKPSTSATTLVDAFKANNNVPSGFIASDLAPLTQVGEYQLWHTLVPHMTESNLAFADLHWRVDTDKLQINEVTYQKILTLKECVKIPRGKGEQIRVLDRCVRVCLYDGFEIVSNIHTIRARLSGKPDDRDLTEDWSFASNDLDTLIDEQPQLLIRSSLLNPNQKLNLLLELSQWCQSTVTQEKCEIACGWVTVPLKDDEPPLLSDTKSHNEILHGGHIGQTDELLDAQYKILRSDGLSGKIDRYKRARIKFSIESRETDLDILYDNLPIQSLIVPINLIKSLVFFRNELAYQLHKRQHPTGLSTTPIDSVFLSTFFKTLDQPDLIYTLRRLYRTRKKRYLSSSASPQQQREEFIKTYEFFIYPLLHYRQLPAYDFHDIASSNERRKLINDMVKRQLPKRKTQAQDILSILLDPNLTDKWTPFTTDEVSFTLQKYIPDYQTDIVA